MSDVGEKVVQERRATFQLIINLFMNNLQEELNQLPAFIPAQQKKERITCELAIELACIIMQQITPDSPYNKEFQKALRHLDLNKIDREQ